MTPPPELDHLVYATPDLERGIRDVGAHLGVEPTPGGQHPGIGTRNAIVALGPRAYLEIIGPDPEQPDPPRWRPFGIDRLRDARLVTWAARTADLERQVEMARCGGLDLGAIVSMSRNRPDGARLSWRLTNPEVTHGGGIVPFLIDWGDSPHPASGLASSCPLVELRAEHPAPNELNGQLEALGLRLRVDAGPAPSLIAVLDSPNGRVELR